MKILIVVVAYALIGFSFAALAAYCEGTPEPEKRDTYSGSKPDDGTFGWFVFCLVGWPLAGPLILLDVVTSAAQEAGDRRKARQKEDEVKRTQRERELDEIIKEHKL